MNIGSVGAVDEVIATWGISDGRERLGKKSSNSYWLVGPAVLALGHGCGAAGPSAEATTCWAMRSAGRDAGPTMRGAGSRGQGAQRLARSAARAGMELVRDRRRGVLGFFYFSFNFPFPFSYHLKLNLLSNTCFTNPLIKQSESLLQHDVTIKAPLGF
jgi:hypothetical protein